MGPLSHGGGSGCSGGYGGTGAGDGGGSHGGAGSGAGPGANSHSYGGNHVGSVRVLIYVSPCSYMTFAFLVHI